VARRRSGHGGSATCIGLGGGCSNFGGSRGIRTFGLECFLVLTSASCGDRIPTSDFPCGGVWSSTRTFDTACLGRHMPIHNLRLCSASTLGACVFRVRDATCSLGDRGLARLAGERELAGGGAACGCDDRRDSNGAGRPLCRSAG